MPEKTYKRPWVTLKHRLDKNDLAAVEQFLATLPASVKARAIAGLGSDTIQRLLRSLSPRQSAELFKVLPQEQASGLLELLEAEEAAAIMDQLPKNLRADILNDVNISDSQAILETMSPEKAQQTRQILAYPENTAGGIMSGEYLAFGEAMTIAEVLSDLETNSIKYADFNVQYAYIVNGSKKLVGVLQMRDLLLKPRDIKISSIMKPEPLKVPVRASLENLIDLFDSCNFVGVPVVDDDDHLLGVARRLDVLEAAGEREKDTYLKASGIVGGEELRSMPVLRRSKRRLSWLTVNILLNIMAASVIAFYQETLSAVIALAVFLPIISDMSGCSGSQAVAVSIRELTLGVTRPGDIFRVLWKESAVGMLNGIVLGLILGLLAFAWKGNIYLGIVIASALGINTVIGVAAGGVIPLILKSFDKDPALASGPILTTITDICGFFLTLSFATMMLAHLR
jgi:magnesium transporter